MGPPDLHATCEQVVGYEGKLAEAFYVIVRGGVVLTRERYVDGDEYDEEVGRLGPGSCFGEHALDWTPKNERKRGSQHASAPGTTD